MIAVHSARVTIKLIPSGKVVRTAKNLRNMVCVTKQGRVLMHAYCGDVKFEGKNRLVFRKGDGEWSFIHEDMQPLWKNEEEMT
jgi:hypothetical protein